MLVSSREVDFKVLRMAIQFQYFFMIKRQNGECNVRNFGRSLFGKSHVPALKVLVLTNDFKFCIGVNEVVDILTKNLLSLMTFIPSIGVGWVGLLQPQIDFL